MKSEQWAAEQVGLHVVDTAAKTPEEVALEVSNWFRATCL